MNDDTLEVYENAKSRMPLKIKTPLGHMKLDHNSYTKRLLIGFDYIEFNFKLLLDTDVEVSLWRIEKDKKFLVNAFLADIAHDVGDTAIMIDNLWHNAYLEIEEQRKSKD